MLKKAAVILMSAFVMASVSGGALAMEVVPDTQPVGVSTQEPRAYELVWKYQRTADGKLQARRWNATLGCWHDPAWITISQ